MTQFYFEPERAADPYALPDAEVFYRTLEDNEVDGWVDGDGDTLPAGWYYWTCLPGCLPDSDPIGPFDSEDDAIEDARDLNFTE